MNLITNYSIFREKFCLRVMAKDPGIRRKWIFIAFYNCDWNISMLDIAIEEVKEKVEQIKYLDSAIWQLEAIPTTNFLCLYMQVTINNVKCRTVISQLFDLFKGAYIMVVDRDGVNAVRNFCSKRENRISLDVYTFGNINKFDYMNKWIAKSSDRMEIKKNKLVENLEMKPLLDDIKYWFDLMVKENNPVLRRRWKANYERAKEMTPAQYFLELESEPELVLTPQQKKAKINREFNKKQKERIACIKRRNITGYSCKPEDETDECPNYIFRAFLERLREVEKERNVKNKIPSDIEWSQEELEAKIRETERENKEKREEEQREEALRRAYLIPVYEGGDDVKISQEQIAARCLELIKETVEDSLEYIKSMSSQNEESNTQDQEKRKKFVEREKEKMTEKLMSKIIEDLSICTNKNKIALLNTQLNELIKDGKISTFSREKKTIKIIIKKNK